MYLVLFIGLLLLSYLMLFHPPHFALPPVLFATFQG